VNPIAPQNHPHNSGIEISSACFSVCVGSVRPNQPPSPSPSTAQAAGLASSIAKARYSTRGQITTTPQYRRTCAIVWTGIDEQRACTREQAPLHNLRLPAPKRTFSNTLCCIATHAAKDSYLGQMFVPHRGSLCEFCITGSAGLAQQAREDLPLPLPLNCSASLL
jgi:hypothetical protein